MPAAEPAPPAPTAGPRPVTFRRWGAVTAVTRLRAGTLARWRLRAAFTFGNATDLAIRPLLAMRVIALARWTLWPDARRPAYLLFETNWSGADQTYIPDFARVMPLQWRSIWDAAEGFPGPLPTTHLVDFVDTVDAGVGHFWTDYREGATTQTILQALELSRQVTRFTEKTRGTSPATFARRWRALLVAVHRLL